MRIENEMNHGILFLESVEGMGRYDDFHACFSRAISANGFLASCNTKNKNLNVLEKFPTSNLKRTGITLSRININILGAL